jgi:cobalt-zinc-cadmium efflux system membrane fusion protein
MAWKLKRSWIVVVGVVGVISLVAALNRQHIIAALSANKLDGSPGASTPGSETPLVELVDGKPLTLRLKAPESFAVLGLVTEEATSAPPLEPLRLPGSLFLDPSRMIHIHSRFNGEIVTMGEIADSQGRKRPLQYGDKVKAGQILAVLWSKEVGEKKSELADAISHLEVSKEVLARLESLTPGVVPERSIAEARRVVEGDAIAVAKAERTLRSWRIAEEEIEGARQEVKHIQERRKSGDAQFERNWAETVIRSAIDGVIVEKNFNVGDIIGPEDELFKVADLSRLMVMANAYEEDLGAIRALKPEDRKWTIATQSDTVDSRIEGSFELVGSVIDPAQRTGVVMGWLDNKRGNLAVGQFVTASIHLPPKSGDVAVAESALIEDGSSTTVFVESKADSCEFSRRRIKVTSRSAGVVHVDSSPHDGVCQPLKAGERVLVSGSLGLGGELTNLVRSSGRHN